MTTLCIETATEHGMVVVARDGDPLAFASWRGAGRHGENLFAHIESALAEARKDLESDDVARLDAARERVEKELHKVAELLYKSQAGQPEAGPHGADGGEAPGGAPPRDEGDVVDAEYTEERGDG